MKKSVKMENCRFCDICSKAKEAVIVFENEGAVAFMDTNPLVEGHVLVVPHRHVERIIDLSDDEIKKLFQAVKKIEEAMLSSLGCEGIDLHQRYSPFLEESELRVGHLHVHLVPRNLNDELHVRIYSKIKRLKHSTEDLKETAEQISSAIK
ncbi:MAG: HIT domain-containing protein [Candidatus Micrarchaeota archaeon]